MEQADSAGAVTQRLQSAAFAHRLMRFVMLYNVFLSFRRGARRKKVNSRLDVSAS